MSTFPSTVGMHHRLPFSHPGERFLRNNQEGMSGGGGIGVGTVVWSNQFLCLLLKNTEIR